MGLVAKLAKLAAKTAVENFTVEAAKKLGEAVGARIGAKIWVEPEPADDESEEEVES